MAVSLQSLEKALQALESALQRKKTDIVRDAVIQRFEFTVELAWKTAKKVMGSASVAPKAIVREMAQQGLIPDSREWLETLDLRNLTSHTYNEDVAEKVYEAASAFAPRCRALLNQLKNS